MIDFLDENCKMIFSDFHSRAKIYSSVTQFSIAVSVKKLQLPFTLLYLCLALCVTLS